VKNKQHRDCWN